MKKNTCARSARESVWPRLTLSLLAALCGTALTAAAQAPAPSERDRLIKDELRFIDGLRAWGMQSYANEAMAAFALKFPEATALIKTEELRGLLAVGNFEKAKAVIAAEPAQDGQVAWQMRLELASGYFAWGKYAEAQGVYQDFFRKYTTPPAGMQEFFRDAAYRYAQMLMLMNKNAEAIGAYRLALQAKSERHVERQMLSEMAELMIKVGENLPPDKRTALFEEARQIANKILWIQDLWFGKAIVYLAHMKMVENDVAGASKLIEDYKADLMSIHNQLVEDSKNGEDLTRLSPMAQCHYLLGVMMQTAAEKLLKGGGDKDKVGELLAGKATGKSGERTAGALQHFLSAFILFPTSQWAAEAGVRAQQVESILKTKFGAKIATGVTEEQWERVRRAQFQGARAEFNQQLFDQAVQSYLGALTLFPEGESSVAAVGELCQSYMELGDDLHSAATASYLAERFGGSRTLATAAGDQLLKLATYCGERQMPERRDTMNELFFTHFPKHARVPGMLYAFGEERVGREDYAGALRYYGTIVTNHPKATVYVGAALRVAFCHAKMGDYTNEIAVLTQLTKTLEAQNNPGFLYINARYRLAQSYMQLGEKFIPSAYNRFNELAALIRKDGDKYAQSADERESNQKALEGALFYGSICLARLKPGADQAVAYRQKAVAGMEDLVRTFPKSAFAPAALNQIGTLYVLLDKPEDARTAFDRLRKDYPETEEAKNSRFLLAKTLMELGYRDKAVEIFKEMFAGGGAYTSGQILTAGRELLKAGENEIALLAFERVLKGETARPAVEPALLGKGQALLALGRMAESADTLKQMLAQFANSGYTVPACLALSQAFGALGAKEPDAARRDALFNDAVKAMNRANKYATAPGVRAELKVGVGRIYVNKAASERQFGAPDRAKEALGFAAATYQTLISFPDSRDADVRRQVEIAYSECIPLLVQMERWDDVIHDADMYLELFPRGIHVSDVRAHRTTALTRGGKSGGAAAVTSETATNAPAAGNAATGTPATNAPAVTTGAVTRTAQP